MPESFEDQISRVEMMSEDDGGTWDLSVKDQAALKTVLKLAKQQQTTYLEVGDPVIIEDKNRDLIYDVFLQLAESVRNGKVNGTVRFSCGQEIQDVTLLGKSGELKGKHLAFGDFRLHSIDKPVVQICSKTRNP